MASSSLIPPPPSSSTFAQNASSSSRWKKMFSSILVMFLAFPVLLAVIFQTGTSSSTGGGGGGGGGGVGRVDGRAGDDGLSADGDGSLFTTTPTSSVSTSASEEAVLRDDGGGGTTIKKKKKKKNVVVNGVPNYHGCTTPLSQSLPYCDNTNLSYDERLSWLLSNLTLEEKIAMISPQPLLGGICAMHSSGKSSIDLPPYMWLVESNSVISSTCYDPTNIQYKCPTTFVGPLGYTASFNKTAWRNKGTILGMEQRALYNLRWHRGDTNTPNDHIGITSYGPNINIIRDPRFGRNSELPSEDPYVNGIYASEFIHGMSRRHPVTGHTLILSYLKHFTAYSRETNRGHDDYNISVHDLFDTYLPAYEMAFRRRADNGDDDDGKHDDAPVIKPTGVMCSYNAINGSPSCANTFLLNAILREKWKNPHAHVTTDCGAIHNLLGPPINASSNITAASICINNGTDLEMGSTVWTDYLGKAVKERGLVEEGRIDEALRRALRPHFDAGRFDPLTHVEEEGSSVAASGWSSLGVESINSTWAQRVSKTAGYQGMVLLKNDRDVLPIVSSSASSSSSGGSIKKKKKIIAVVGPMGVTTDLMSDYAAAESPHYEGGCYPKSDQSCIVTIADAIKQIHEQQEDDAGDDDDSDAPPTTLIAKGVDIDTNRTSGIQEAIDIVKRADITILVLGNTRKQEHETHDRTSITLPGLQETLAHLILNEQSRQRNKRTILILSNGGPVAIDGLISRVDGIIEAFNPAQQSLALAELIFGKVDGGWGKLPYTIYPASYVNEQSMTNYDMSGDGGNSEDDGGSATTSPGRTYRYYPTEYTMGKPLFTFGYGLSYTTFHLGISNINIINNKGRVGKEGGADNVVTNMISSTTNYKKNDDDGRTRRQRDEQLYHMEITDMDNLPTITFQCDVTNTGKRNGDAIVLVYHTVGEDIAIRRKRQHPVPHKSLVDFERLSNITSTTAGIATTGASSTSTTTTFSTSTQEGRNTKSVIFQLSTKRTLSLIDHLGRRVVYPGYHSYIFDLGDGSPPAEVRIRVGKKKKNEEGNDYGEDDDADDEEEEDEVSPLYLDDIYDEDDDDEWEEKEEKDVTDPLIKMSTS